MPRRSLPAGKRVIDLSADFRIADLATYQKYYGEHHAPDLLPGARFVLPELTAAGVENGGEARGGARLLSDERASCRSFRC